MESKGSNDADASKEKLSTGQLQVEGFDQKADEGQNNNDINENNPENPAIEDVNKEKSYPVILEAKPQHLGPAMQTLTEESKIKEEEDIKTMNDDGEIPVSDVMLQTDADHGATTIVQYETSPKMEGEPIQVKLFCLQILS